MSSLHVWITVSSLANKDPNNAQSLLFRQIELNWINAPLDDENDYIGLYLDNQPDGNALPVSVHRLNGQTSGQVITDYYLPQIDFFNASTANIPLKSSDSAHETTTNFQYSYPRSPFSPPIRIQQPFNQDGRVAIRYGSGEEGTRDHHQPQQRRSTLLVGECIGYCLGYHSKNKILATNCLRTNPNWMQDSIQYIGTRSITSLMIPGSHNSATYPKQLDKTVLHMINKYQINQDESIFNQLTYGIRHLDLRVGYSKVKQRPEKLWIYHDIFRTEISLNEVLEQVKRFLDLTSHEVVIMDFHRFTVGFQNENIATQRERHAKLIDLIFKHLGHYIVPSYLGQHAPLNEYIAMGKRLIIGYANKVAILGSQADQQLTIFGLQQLQQGDKKQVRDIDAVKQDQDDGLASSLESQIFNNFDVSGDQSDGRTNADQTDRRMGTRLFNKLKSLKLISNSFSKRSIEGNKNSLSAMRLTAEDITDVSSSVSRAALFFSPVRHLWPNKDTIEGLAQYMNDTTCRKYFGELRSMMVELTPTVFGAISDKYDGNRKLAQLVNRQVTDWIRDRWLHCINIVASDFFLGNDLVRLSIYANKMRVLHRNVDLNPPNQQCTTFRKVEHLLDKSKIPIQFAYHHQHIAEQSTSSARDDLAISTSNSRGGQQNGSGSRGGGDIIRHISSDGNQIYLRTLTSGLNMNQSGSRDKRDSFVENVSDGFTNLVSSFKRFLNL